MEWRQEEIEQTRWVRFCAVKARDGAPELLRCCWNRGAGCADPL